MVYTSVTTLSRLVLRLDRDLYLDRRIYPPYIPFHDENYDNQSFNRFHNRIVIYRSNLSNILSTEFVESKGTMDLLIERPQMIVVDQKELFSPPLPPTPLIKIDVKLRYLTKFNPILRSRNEYIYLSFSFLYFLPSFYFSFSCFRFSTFLQRKNYFQFLNRDTRRNIKRKNEYSSFDKSDYGLNHSKVMTRNTRSYSLPLSF